MLVRYTEQYSELEIVMIKKFEFITHLLEISFEEVTNQSMKFLTDFNGQVSKEIGVINVNNLVYFYVTTMCLLTLRTITD